MPDQNKWKLLRFQISIRLNQSQLKVMRVALKLLESVKSNESSFKIVKES